MPPILRIQAPDRRHPEAMCDLIGKTFRHKDYWAWHRELRESYIGNSHYDWGVSRIGLVDDEVATHFGVWDYRMRIGTATVRCGGIGAVATHGGHRKRGYMDETARAAIAAMREAGYDCSILFGIADYYHKFGYVRAWPDARVTAKTADLPAAAPTVRPRAFTVRNRAEINALYNAAYATVTGSAVRPTFRNLGYTARLEGLRWDDGYVMFTPHPGTLECVEAAGDPAQCLRVLAREARRRDCAEVQFYSLPWESPLLRLVRRGNCRVEATYQRSGGAMIRVLNLGPMLAAIAGELTRRLQASAMAGWCGALRLASPEDAATLHIADGVVMVGPDVETSHTLAPGWAVAQLLLGTDAADAIIDADLPATGDARQVCAALFPKQDIALALYDRY